MQELVRSYHKDEGPARCAITIDLMKAYDFVDWMYLFDAMEAVDFPQVYVNWIKQYVCSARFSVVLNGELEGYFQRGLRQGDLSLLTFFRSLWRDFILFLKLRLTRGSSLFTLNAGVLICATLLLQMLYPNY